MRGVFIGGEEQVFLSGDYAEVSKLSLWRPRGMTSVLKKGRVASPLVFGVVRCHSQ